jgi:hypothetical protein
MRLDASFNVNSLIVRQSFKTFPISMQLSYDIIFPITRKSTCN